MELTRKIGRETVSIILTEEELNQAHVERVQRFMQEVLMSSKFCLGESHAAMVAELALSWYCLGEHELTAHDCVCREYAKFCDEFTLHSLGDFQRMIQKMISGSPMTEQFSTHAVFTMNNGRFIEACATEEQLCVQIIPASEMLRSRNAEILLRAIRQNTLSVFEQCTSLMYSKRQDADISDFCAEVIPPAGEWRVASLSLGLLLKEFGLA